MDPIVKLSRSRGQTEQTSVTIPYTIARQLKEGGATHVSVEFLPNGNIVLKPMTLTPTVG